MAQQGRVVRFTQLFRLRTKCRSVKRSCKLSDTSRRTVMEFSRYCHFRYARAAAEWDFCSEISNFGFRSTWATPQPRRHPVAARNRKRRLHPVSTPSLMRFWLADMEILRFFVQKFCSEIQQLLNNETFVQKQQWQCTKRKERLRVQERRDTELSNGTSPSF